jgi:hypothetical protein
MVIEACSVKVGNDKDQLNIALCVCGLPDDCPEHCFGGYKEHGCVSACIAAMGDGKANKRDAVVASLTPIRADLTINTNDSAGIATQSSIFAHM